MTAHHDDAAGAGAVVRKPPVKETAIGGTCGGAAGFDLSGLDRCRRDPPAQLLRYGTKIAIGKLRLVENDFGILCSFNELRVVKIPHMSTSTLYTSRRPLYHIG